MRLLDNRQTLHRRLAVLEQTGHRLQKQLDEAQQLSGLGLAWAVTAHELNNLLTPMTNYARLALQHPDDPDLNKKALEKSVFLGQRAAEILEKVMSMASGKTIEFGRVEVDKLLDDVLLCIGRDFEKDGIRLVRQCQPGASVQGDRVMLGQMLLNMILNARRAMLPDGGQIHISVCVTENGTQIEIADTGCGMEQETIAQIFDPFFSTADNNAGPDGNGLGLYFCQQIVEAHNGNIQVESAPEQGSTFRILLPTD